MELFGRCFVLKEVHVEFGCDSVEGQFCSRFLRFSLVLALAAANEGSVKLDISFEFEA